MKQKDRNASIKMISIERIHIMNPRERNKENFLDMAENIRKVGLKRPITVIPSKGHIGKDYDLVCGEGRIKAFLACGQTTIPAIVITATEEEALIMSLVENLARRQHRSLDLLQGIEVLIRNNYDARTIAKKTGLSETYAKAIIDLLERGEERLIAAVEAGHLPLSVAVSIATSPGDEQKALQEAYETKQLRGQKLIMVKRMLENRKHHGKSLKNNHRGGKNKNTPAISSKDLMKMYHQEVDRIRLLTRKADIADKHQLFAVEAIRRLTAEPKFLQILKNEGLDTMPKPLAHLLEKKR